MISVIHQGQVLDVVCRRHPAMPNWYVVYVGETMIGQAMLEPGGRSWAAVCDINPEHTWLAQGYHSRRHAVQYLLRCAGYWPRQ